jgi:transcriptional regulator with XRE-family HTH domain
MFRIPNGKGPSACPHLRLGIYLRRLRDAYGKTQEEVIAGSGEYSEESAYRRVETGRHMPTRRVLIRVIVSGIGARYVYEVDHALRLAGYATLSPQEEAELPLAQPK